MLVGRQAELEMVSEALARVAAGGASLILIEGEAGIGKTRLLEASEDLARARGFAIATGGAAELEADLPFGLVIDALDRTLASAGPNLASGLRVAERDELAAVFPSLGHLRRSEGTGATGDRYGAYKAISTVLERLAQGTPLALLLDDVHWADRASVELLAQIARRPPDARLAIFLFARRTELPEALATALHDSERAGRLTRIGLGPLSYDEIEGLLPAELADASRRAIYEDSGGNPFYLEQLSRSAADPRSSETASEDPRLPGVPKIVREALARELAALPEDARALARGGAVAGDPFTPDVAAVAAALAGEEALSALDGLIERELVHPEPEGPLFRFRHPIVRRAVYEGAPVAWRVGAHRRVAAELASRGASISARAHHEERSAQIGDTHAIEVLKGAGVANVAMAPAIAVRYLRAALRLLPDGEEHREHRLQLLVPLATALGASGELAEARAVLGELLGLIASSGLEEPRTRVIAWMAAIDHLLGRYEEARSLLADALERVAPGSPVDSARLLMETSQGRYFVRDWDGMWDAAKEARALASEGGETALECETTAIAAVAACDRGDARRASERVSEAARLADAVPDDALAARLGAAFWLGMAETHLGRYADAARHLDRGLAIAERTGNEYVLVPLHVALAAAWALAGRLEAGDGAWVSGRDHALAAVEIARLAAVPNLVAWARAGAAWVALREGDLGEAIARGEEVEATFASLPTPPMSGGICALAEARIQAGEAETGRDRLLAECGGAGLPRLEPVFRPMGYETLTRAEAALQDGAAAARWAAHCYEAAAALGLRRDEASARRAAAVAELAQANATAASDAASDAVEAAELAGSAIEATRARLLLGEALLGGDRPERAAETLKRAFEGAVEIGARRDRDRAATLLRRLGQAARAPASRPVGVGVDELSEREREVAQLVVERMTNREIAARLYLSEKTVERHLGSAFRKVGVSSRVELAQAIERS